MIVAILQARCSSTRLPGKVMRPILGRPMLSLQVERIRRAHLLDQLVIATSADPADDPIAELCMEQGLSCYRGSLHDVLDRVYQAARRFEAQHIVRLTGDCPLTDPELIDRVISHHLKGRYDCTNNVMPPTFPDGLDVEVIRMSALETVWQKAVLRSDREHVTPYLYQRPACFKIGHVANARDLSDLRWTVDEPLDFELVTRIYAALYPTQPDFRTADILRLLERRPELVILNSRIMRNEGYRREE